MEKLYSVKGYEKSNMNALTLSLWEKFQVELDLF